MGVGLRLLRAALAATREGDDASGRPWAEAACCWTSGPSADAEDAPRRVLSDAVALAVAGDQPKLAGRLIGRALLRTGTGGDPVGLYLRAAAARDRGRRVLASEGLRGSAPGNPAAQPWLDRLASALTAGDVRVLRQPAADWSPAAGIPPLVDAQLQLGMAGKAKDWPEAETFARMILERWPDAPNAAERLGAVLLLAGKLDELLALHQGESLSSGQRVQRIEALKRLDRMQEALDEARAMLRATDASDDALLALGRLLKESDPNQAIAALSSVSGGPRVDLLRGELLEDHGDEDAAGQIYEDLIRVSGGRSIVAWRSLARVRDIQDREAEFVRRVSEAIDAPPRGLSRNALALLVLLRAQAKEALENYEGALADYQSVLRVLPSHPAALNNIAWIMATHIAWSEGERPAKLEEALGLVNRAYEEFPAAAVLHTRAKVLDALGRTKEALADVKQGVALTEKRLTATDLSPLVREQLRERRGRYLIEQGALLEALGAMDEARAIYELVREEHPLSAEAELAAAALKRLAG